MKVDIWSSHGNGNIEGEISFLLKSGTDSQLFKRSWTVINTLPYDQKTQRLECFKALVEVRLKELLWYLGKQVEQGVISVNGELKPLRDDWRIE